MSGHSKWSKVKHQKAAGDIKKGLIFTKLGNAITIAVKSAGGITDPNSNFKLRLAIEKAKQANMPKANIERAIERGVGKGGEAQLEEVTYEGFGPGQIAILIKAVTDNRQRTNASLKNLFASHQGRIAGPGSVAYLFEELGRIEVKKEAKSEDDYFSIALEVGSTDLTVLQDTVVFFTQPADLGKVKEKIAAQGIEIIDSELIYKPKTTLKIEDREVEEKLKQLLEQLENNDDIQKIYSNAAFS